MGKAVFVILILECILLTFVTLRLLFSLWFDFIGTIKSNHNAPSFMLSIKNEIEMLSAGETNDKNGVD